jgi:hypothetical protein
MGVYLRYLWNRGQPGVRHSVALINRAPGGGALIRALFIRNPHPPIRTTAETADREPVVPAAFTVKFTVGFVQQV